MAGPRPPFGSVQGAECKAHLGEADASSALQVGAVGERAPKPALR